MAYGRIEPDDLHNRTLLSHVHPEAWQNPEPRDRYHLVVLGAGSAGLISAAIASSLGARVALVERHLLGGDCLNVGCVPSKALLHAARRTHATRGTQDLGLLPPGETPEFGAVMESVRHARARIAPEDSAARYQGDFGVDVFLGEARFVAPDRVRVGDAELSFRRAVIATGGHPTLPPVPGLAEADPLTNETLFGLEVRPPRFGVIGAGPIGCEMAQAFQRLGSRTTVLELSSQVLGREDPDASAIVQRALEADGVELLLGCQIQSVERAGAGQLVHVKREDGVVEQHAFDALLVAAGRAPNVEGLGLEDAGVDFDVRRGVRVDDRLRTTNKRIYAAGDVIWHPEARMNWKFTHASDAMAKIVVQNALFFRRLKLSSLAMPWCTYTDPEVAHVGLYAHDAEDEGIAIDTYTLPLGHVNRAVAEGRGDEDGFFRVHVKQGTDKIVGATVVAPHAGDLVTHVSQAIAAGKGLASLGNVIYPYPTLAEGWKALAGQYTRTRLSPTAKRAFERWFRIFS